MINYTKTLWYALLLALPFQSYAQDLKSNVQNFQDKNLIQKVLWNTERGTPQLVTLNATGSYSKKTEEEAAIFLREVLNLDETITLKKGKSSLSPDGLKVTRFKQYYKGIRIEHGIYNAVSKGTILQAITLEHYDIEPSLNPTPKISEEIALQNALKHIGAQKYAWDDINLLKLHETNTKILSKLDSKFDVLYPEGELVIVDDYNEAGINMHLAYKFNIKATEPLSRADIYVDAENGTVLFTNSTIKHINTINKSIAKTKRTKTYAMVQATAETRYSGTQTFETTLLEEDITDPTNIKPQRYVLKGNVPVKIVNSTTGVLENLTVVNETRSFDRAGNNPSNMTELEPSYEITDGSSRPEENQTVIEVADNFWSKEEHFRDRFESPEDNYPVNNEANNDDQALDVHWNSEMIIEYWAERHNRWSYDGKGGSLTNFVHFSEAFDAASYEEGTSRFGDGSYQGGTNPRGFLSPLTSMDVSAHEIGHGVCETTSDLVASSESGALNEGFSDIWGAAVEAFILELHPTLPYQPFSIGEQFDERDNGIQPAMPGEENSPEMEAIRFMDDPKAVSHPDCYRAVNWTNTEQTCSAGNDGCGVHTNSGVLNKWFYLLVRGSGNPIIPGLDKAASDDEVNDNFISYEVEGLGFKTAEQIAFQSEIALTPNATFPEMRETSILIAQQLYGIDSFEERQVTNAWHAVCVGSRYIDPAPNQAFFKSSNISLVRETSGDVGCNAATIYSIAVTAVRVNPAITINIETSGSTASEDLDFNLSATTLNLEGTSNQIIDVTVYDDALIEDEETIQLSFEYNGETLTQDISILDDDVLLSIGSLPIQLLDTETFDTSGAPQGWTVDLETSSSINTWYFNGNGTEAGRAYISYDAPAVSSNDSAIYDSNTESISTLITPEISALGLDNVNVSFDWQAGGEFNPVNPNSPFDFGALLYSFDGVTFFPVEDARFWATSTDGDSRSGTFDGVIPELANSNFVLGFRWSNDANTTTSAFSFAIDNLNVTVAPNSVATALDATDSNMVNIEDDIFFKDVATDDIIARIQNPSADLGCVEMTITGSGTETVNNDNAGVNRSGKVIQINPSSADAATAAYDVTFYLTAEELAGFTDINALQIMKVEGDDVDAATPSNSTISGGLFEDFLDTEGYATFKGTFTGFSAFTIVEEASASVNDLNVSGVAIYPSPVQQGQLVNITTKDIAINSAAVFDVRGAKVSEQRFNGQTDAQLNTAALQTGFYFVRLNNDANKTFKFIVR